MFARLGLISLTAALLLAMAISAASARSLEVSNQNIRVTWSSLEYASSLVTIRCRVTLEGSFHTRTMAKVARSLVGAITRAPIDNTNCTNGQASNQGLPWHMTFESFTGTLPNITGVQILIARFLLEIARPAELAITCTYGTATDNGTGSAGVTAGTRAVTNLVPVSGRNIANLLRGTSAFCPSTGTLIGSASDGRVTVLNSAGLVTVRLI
jgi:hypothetical protein